MKTPVLYRCTAGDKNANLTAAERQAAAQAGDFSKFAVVPIHDFFVLAFEEDGIGVPMQVVATKINAKTSDDLPKPFNLVRVENVVTAMDPSEVKAIKKFIAEQQRQGKGYRT